MLQIPCPWCGQRDEVEFAYGGEPNSSRLDPVRTTNEEWADYLFNRHNQMGRHLERWCHSYGCGRWFTMVRDTLKHEIISVHKVGDVAPGKGETRA